MQRDLLEKQLREYNVELVRAIYVGPDGIARGKAFLPGSIDDVLAHGLGLTQAQASVTVFDHLPPESQFQPVGEVRICPDINTFQVLPYLPGHARMISNLNTIQGDPWELCPRHLLQTFLDRLSERGLVLRAAFENEFTIYRNVNGNWEPLDQTNCFSSAAMDMASPYILPMLSALEQQGVQVEKYYPEAGHGQHEIPIRHQAGMLSADQQVIFRETVRGVALANDFRVSFMPKASPDSAGNGCHIHFSLWDIESEQNLFYDPNAAFGLSELALQFTAGVLHHLPAVMAFTAPTTNSYSRFVERCWSSCYASWGPDNREATLRAASGFLGQESATVNVEFKPSDPTCNPYLALSALLCAGLDGIDQGASPGEPVMTDPALLSEAERESRGMRRYPSDLSGSLSALEADSLFQRHFGESRIQDYLIMKRAEIEMINSLEHAAEQTAYLFRF